MQPGSKVIWKFPVPRKTQFTLQMPVQSRILSCGIQDGDGVLWAVCNPSLPKEERLLMLAVTGEPLDERRGRFIGTMQFPDGVVAHLWESM